LQALTIPRDEDGGLLNSSTRFHRKIRAQPSRLAGTEAYCRTVFAYVNKNPMKHGVVNSITELDSYPWCGHKEIVSPRMDDLSCFHKACSLFLTKDEYFNEISQDTQVDDGEISVTIALDRIRCTKEGVSSLDAVISSTASAHRVMPDAIRGRGRTSNLSRAREEFLEEAVYACGFTITEAAAYLGITTPSASAALARCVSRKERTATKA